MKILFVHPPTTMSIGDVARGYRSAFVKAGHEIADYRLDARMAYHFKAIPTEAFSEQLLAKQCSETILNEAMYHGADLVVIICGLNVHPIALWLLGKVGIRVAVIFTESPYEDIHQKKWADLSHVDSTVDLTIFTNDRFSAIENGWNHLPPSFDPAIHKPSEPMSGHECDVLMIGTGWPERQKFFEKVNWDGINLRLFGLWPHMTADSPLIPFYHQLIIKNTDTPPIYCSAKINLNFHRQSETALSPNPRIFEVAACGAFQLSDARADMEVMFKENIPTFKTPEELEAKIRYFIDKPGERKFLAAGALDCACNEDFDARVQKFSQVMNMESVTA